VYKLIIILLCIILGPVEAGGPHVIEAKLDSNTISLKNVLFGDVWVCSGQSNMQFSMSQVRFDNYFLKFTVFKQ
jgi:hypothetical protein